MRPPGLSTGRITANLIAACVALVGAGLAVSAVDLSRASAGPGVGATFQTAPSSGLSLLSGTLVLAPASCPGGSPVGSYFEVTDGNKAYTNNDSHCEGGAVTLLNPGRMGLALGQFSPDAVPTFDAAGNSRSNLVIQPTDWDGHLFGVATSPYDVQDAPTGPLVYAPPQAVVQGTTLTVDLRSLDVTYEGPPGATCPSAQGLGCWEEGVKTATGTFNWSSHQFTLTWLASQGFTGEPVGVLFHLEGTLDGRVEAADAGPGQPAASGLGSAPATASGGSTGTSPNSSGTGTGTTGSGTSSSGSTGSSGGGTSSAGSPNGSGSTTGNGPASSPAGGSSGSGGVTAGSTGSSGGSPIPSNAGSTSAGSSNGGSAHTTNASNGRSGQVATGTVGSGSSGDSNPPSGSTSASGSRRVAANVVTDDVRLLKHPKAGGILAALAALFFVADAFWLGTRLTGRRRVNPTTSDAKGER